MIPILHQEKQSAIEQKVIESLNRHTHPLFPVNSDLFSSSQTNSPVSEKKSDLL